MNEPAVEQLELAQDGGRGRGRVVMLVDNAVSADSRVQKQARSMAAAGWDVTLLGQAPGRRAKEWWIGGARVRLLPMNWDVAARPRFRRHCGLRRPLAYRDEAVARRQVARVKAYRADLRARREAGSGRFLLRRAAAGLLLRWTRFRAARQAAAHRARRATGSRQLALLRLGLWRLLLRDRFWRRAEPGLWAYELTFGPVVDALRPDLIHANDFRMVGVGARAKLRARAAGRDVKLVWDAHEYLPGIRPRVPRPGWLDAHCAHEREYARHADAVLTVSGTLAELLWDDHQLTDPPVVVLNAPDLEPPEEPAPSLRERCGGLGPDTPLLVYSGAVAEQRGLATVVEALPQLRDVHAALVVADTGLPYLRELMSRARELGVDERLHLTPYVPHQQVVDHLAGADLGVIPLHHWQNHEIALITKFMEYAHARLPIVVSDVRTMAEAVRAHGIGEVFAARDTDAFAAAVRAVLDVPERYRKAYEEPGLLARWTWERQAENLDAVYERLLASSSPRSGARP